MRNFRMKRTKPIFISKAAFVNVTLLSGVMIFVALAVLTGRLVSNGIKPDSTDTLGKPTQRATATLPPNESQKPTENPTHSPMPEAPTPTPTQNNGVQNTDNATVVKVLGQEFYFVQLGVFTNEKNANTCADSIASRGGAGYVMSKDGKFYIFAMCSADSDNAKDVISSLKSQGYSTLLKCFSHSGMEITLRGNSDSVSRIADAYASVIKSNEEIEKVIEKFEKGELTRPELKSELQKLLGTVNENKEIFSHYSGQNKIFNDANELCNSFYSDISSVLKLDNDIKLKSELKKTYIKNVFSLIEYLDNVSLG